ncbi:MAG TPA: HD domain-containing phosphohydrolase, partial [Nitrospiria bacterium]|nr:HD domain-containing phosphohydrolase [Nitrospiria bacterium]
MAHENIVLVAPEETLRQVTSDILKNYRVQPAASQEEAFGILQETKVDLLIVNLPFQEIPGICSRIQEFNREVPALFLIHPSDLAQSVEVFKGGVSSVVLKPFTRQELLSRVEESLWKVRLLNENVRLKLLFPLYEMTQNLFIGPKLPELFRQIVSIVMRETGGDFVFLSLLRNSGEVLFQDFKSKPGCHVSDVASFSRWISKRFHFLRAPLSLGEEGLGDPEILEKLRGWRLSSLMIYPLVSRFNLTGFFIAGKSLEKQFYRDGDGELLSIIGHQLSTVLENYGLVEELENSRFESLKALASAIEAKDAYTSGHCDRLVDYSYLIAERMNLTQEEKKLLRYGAALHDIGKIGIRESILGKPGKLTSEEYEEMKRHPRIGANMLKNINFLCPVAPI